MNKSQHPKLPVSSFARYQRQLELPEIGLSGQYALSQARVLCVGVGGLGSISAPYLVGSGVGVLGLVDGDVVDKINLHRQILYGERVLNQSKCEVAGSRLRDLNPDCEIVTHPVLLEKTNVVSILEQYDLILDGSDNFETRLLVNQTAIELGIPVVSGTVSGMKGQVTVFCPPEGPCYTCLYGHELAPKDGPSCDGAGVLGPGVGVVGSIQAAEAIKWIVGKSRGHAITLESCLLGRVLLIDTLTMRFKSLQLLPDPDCAHCGPIQSSSTLSTPSTLLTQKEATPMSKLNTISAEDLKARLDEVGDKLGETFILLDIRTPEERAQSHIGGELIPLPELAARMGELDKDKEIILYCTAGRRSAMAAAFLQEEGFEHLLSLEGGLIGWENVFGDIKMPKVKKIDEGAKTGHCEERSDEATQG